jgi:hypothetical protein
MINKVVYGDKVLIDLTADTVTSEKMIRGTTAHMKDGSVITGTADCTVEDDTLVMPKEFITPME